MSACPTCGVNADGYTDLLNANNEKLAELRAENEHLRRALAEVWKRLPELDAEWVPDEYADLAESVLRAQ